MEEVFWLLKCYFEKLFGCVMIDIVLLIFEMMNDTNKMFAIENKVMYFDTFGKQSECIIGKIGEKCNKETKFVGFLDVIVNSLNCFVIMRDGITYCYGENDYGKLGVNMGSKVVDHVVLPLRNVRVIGSGSWHVLAATKDGLWGCGNNWGCRFGITKKIKSFIVNEFAEVCSPCKNVDDIFAIECGDYHSLLLTKAGVFVCGVDIFEGFKRADFDEDVVAAKCFDNGTFLLTRDGCLHKGLRKCGFPISKIKIEGILPNNALCTEEVVWQCGMPTSTEGGGKIVSISSNSDCALFVREDGKIYAYNFFNIPSSYYEYVGVTSNNIALVNFGKQIVGKLLEVNIGRKNVMLKMADGIFFMDDDFRIVRC